MGNALELIFETPIPVVGQIMVLEAVDYLYALMALAHTDWREDFRSIPNWQESIVIAPEKLLPPASNLHLTHMYPGSAKELVEGIAGPVEKFIEFLLLYREKKIASKIKNVRDATDYVKQHLLPLLDKMKENGVPQRNIERMMDKASDFLDQVLDALLSRKQIKIVNVSASTPPGYCPACGKQIGAKGGR